MGEKLTDVGQREETKSDGVSGKEIGLGIQVVIVDRDVNGEARAHKSANEVGFERGK